MSVSPGHLWQGRPIGDPEGARLCAARVPPAGDPLHGAWLHFRQRVGERIGRGVSAEALWRTLIHCVETGRDDLVRCLGRINRTGRRLWQFRVPDGRTFFAVYDHRAGVPVTVLTPGQIEKGGSRIRRISGRATCG